MGSITNILVPIKDCSARALPAVDKAAQLAAALGARMELFHDIATAIPVEALQKAESTLRGIKTEMRQTALSGLERLAAPLRKRGIVVSVAAVWDYPPYEAIVRRAVAIGADLIVAPRRDRHRLPALLGYTDWELLRSSPVAVLLVKTSASYRRPQVLAAVDPTHAHAKPSTLDPRILDYGTQVSRALRGALHVVHAYFPQPIPPSITFDTVRRKSILADAERAAQAIFASALPKSIPASRRHLIRGNPVAVVPATARKLGSNIVVIGAVSRSALKRLFIGNTAESVMDALRCDLLVVKPAQFAVKHPRARRGTNLISIPLII